MPVNGQLHVPAALHPDNNTVHHAGLVGPTAGLDDLEERKISRP